MRVGFIGLGSQGAPMAQRIALGGHSLTIWARREASLEPFGKTAVSVASTPSQLGAESDVVGICVVNDDDVENVLLRPDGVIAGMTAGGVIAIHSTIRPDTCLRLADAAAAHGVAIVDAPVSGGGPAAAERRLLVMVGGAEADVARCRPMFETFGNPVIHLGPLGTGQIAKLLNNFVFTAQLAAALDTYAFAGALGMDRAAVARVLANGSGGSRAAGFIAATNFDPTGLSRVAVPLLRKDLGIMLEVARDRSAEAPASLVDLADRALALLGEP